MSKLFTFILLCFVSFTLCDEAIDKKVDDMPDATKTSSEPAMESVINLTKDTFDDCLQKNEFVLVGFFAPWCKHCKKLLPEYEGAAKELKQENITLAAVDATVEVDLANRYNIPGYPTLKAFHKGKAIDYKGGRTKDSIIQWVHRLTGETVTEVTSEKEAKDSIKDDVTVVVGHFKSNSTSGATTFYEVADEMRTMGKFIAIINSSGDDTVSIWRKDEKATDKHSIKELAGLKTFLELEKFPLFGEINGTNYNDYAQNGRDIGWFLSYDKDYKTHHSIISVVAQKFREKINFVWLDLKEFKDHAEDVLGVREFPALVIQQKEARYVYDGKSFTDAAPIIEFVQKVFDGKVEKQLLSEDIPETNDEPVKVVVGKTFNTVVLQSDKDVFFEVYAPWCGHCKQFEAIYNDFALSVADNPNVLVTKMDGTKNEIPNPNFQITGYPFVFFVKAGTDTPIIYDNQRTVEALTEFLNKHGSKSDSSDTVKDEL